jgi:HD-like signal output (HDOD) protein
MISAPLPRERLLHVVKTLPAAPQILARLGQMRLDPIADLNDVTALLRCDTALTARIIRIANTAAYTVGEPFASIEQALARVGFGEIYRIAGLAAVAQMTNQSLKFYGVSGVQLRENSLLCALLIEALAPKVGFDAQDAYSAGLLRSIGKIALEGFLRTGPKSEAFDPAAGRPLEEWERSQAGFTSGEAAAFVLAEWRFPASIATAISTHLFPDLSTPDGRLGQLLNLAASTAEVLGAGLPGEHSYWGGPDERLSGLDLTEPQVEETAKAVMQRFAGLKLAVS